MEEGGWGWIFRGIMWVTIRCAMLLGWAIQKTYLFIFRTTATVPVKQTRTQAVAENDARRVAECGGNRAIGVETPGLVTQ